jgi:hypothetical protein
MHESALIFVPAATFGQIMPKCDTALQPQLLKTVEKIHLAAAGPLTRSQHQAAAAANVREECVSPWEL